MKAHFQAFFLCTLHGATDNQVLERPIDSNALGEASLLQKEPQIGIEYFKLRYASYDLLI